MCAKPLLGQMVRTAGAAAWKWRRALRWQGQGASVRTPTAPALAGLCWARRPHDYRDALPRQAFTEVVLPGRSDKPADLAPGTGAVQQAGKDKVAVYKDEDGTEHVFAAACPHLGCLVQWNPLDGTFGAAPLPSVLTVGCQRMSKHDSGYCRLRACRSVRGHSRSCAVI
jgi:hypothetical protein